MGRCEINFKKKVKKYCLNKRGCRIDKLMWIFCKNEYIKYKKICFFCKIDKNFTIQSCKCSNYSLSRKKQNIYIYIFIYIYISCGGGWLPLHHGIVRFQLKAPERDN